MNKNTMIYKVGKHIALFMAAIFVAMVIDGNLHKSGIHPFGGLMGGLLLGVFIVNHRILYGALCGFIYTALILTIYIMMGLDKKLSLGLLLSNVFILKESVNILSFVLGAWLGGPVKKRIETMNKNTFIYKTFKYVLLFFAAIVVTGVVDQVLMKCEIPEVGGIVGGLFLAIFLKNPLILYGVLCGILNVLPATAYKVIAGLLSGMPISDVFANIVGWRVILPHLFIYIFLFSLGIWLGKTIKNKFQKMKSGQKSDEKNAISANNEGRKESLMNIIDYLFLFIAVIIITTILNQYMSRHGIIPLSGFLGGIMLGALLKKPRIRYGVLFGTFYVILLTAIGMAMIVLKSNLPADFILKTIVNGTSINANDILLLVSQVVLFALGTWFAGEVKIQIQNMRVKSEDEMLTNHEVVYKYETIINKIVRYLMLLGTIFAISFLTGSLMMKLGIPMFGELIGGVILGMFLEKPRVHYGALFGLIYAAIEYLLSIISVTDTADPFFIFLCVPAIFALGTWLGIIVRKRMERNKETELAKP